MNSLSSSEKTIERYLSLLSSSSEQSRGADFFNAEAEFIAVAKDYVEEQGYDHAFQALLSMGVSEKILTAASIARRNSNTPEAVFVQFARPYFESGGITYQELIDKGVPIDVLNAAGIKPDNEPN